MLKTSKSVNWSGESVFGEKLGATFYTTVSTNNEISTISMKPQDYTVYMENISEIITDFQSFQQEILKYVENEKKSEEGV